MAVPTPAATLPLARLLLRVLVIANWVMAAAILTLLLARAVAIPGRPLDIDAGFSVNGWLAVLLTFVLARVFAEGARMRDDLEGTV